MCSISGYCGLNMFSEERLKLLSMFGSLRGVDSFGVVIDNNAYKSVKSHVYGETSLGDSLEYQQRFSYGIPENNFTVLQHNRKKSSGFLNLAAAHPYEYPYLDDDGNEQSFFFMHNGTLTNVHVLAQKYGYQFHNFETDSHMFGQIILDYGFEEVFTDYEGGAACAFYWSDDPNSLYLWKGAERMSYWSKDAKKNVSYDDAERPLHYTIDNNGFYFASLGEYLKGATFDKKEIYEVNDNTLMYIKNGEILSETVYDRIKILAERKKLKAIQQEKVRKKLEIERKEKQEKEIKTGKVRTLDGEWSSAYGRANLIYYRKGHYYLNQIALHGKVYYDMFGTKNNEFAFDNTEHYFYNGLWLRDKVSFDTVNAEKPSSVAYAHLHPDSYYISAQGFYRRNGAFIANQYIRPKFSIYYLEINSQSKLAGSIAVKNAITQGLLTNEQLFVEVFNSVYVSDKAFHLSSYKDVVRYQFLYLNTGDKSDEVDFSIMESDYIKTIFPNAHNSYNNIDIELLKINLSFDESFKSIEEAELFSKKIV